MSNGFRLPRAAYLSPKLGYRPGLIEIALASLAINLLGLAVAIVTMQVYDRILVHRNFGTLNLLCLGAAIAVAAEAILRLCRAYAMAWAAAAFEHTVTCNAVRHTLTEKTSNAGRLGIGEYLQRVGAIGKIRDFYSGQSLATLIDLPFIFIFLALIAYVGGPLVIAPIALLMALGLRAFGLGRKLKAALDRRNRMDDARYDFLIQTLTGVHTIKALGIETQFERRFEARQEACSRANYEVASLSARAFDQGVVASNMMMIAVAAFGAPMALSGQLSFGTLLACVLLSGRIMQPVQKALGFWTRLQDIKLAHRKLGEHFSGPLLANTPPPAAERNEGRVELRDVSFSHDRDAKLLDGVTLSLAPGEVVAISGEQGAGKQTLLKLIAGMYAPSAGEIRVNGIDLHLCPSDVLVEHVGYLPPVGVIFRGTIAENISRFGRIPEARMREIADLLGLDEEIAALPAGYETRLVGGNTDAIPPGLRQRIAIARALAAKPRVLLFYNADRALDKEGYNCVFRLLGRLKGRVTMVLVTNDRNIVQLADRHLHLDRGRLVDRRNDEAASLLDVHAYKEMRL